MALLPTATRNSQADNLADLVDGGTGAGKIRLYTSAAKTTQLAELALNNPAYGTAGAQGAAGAGTQPATAGRAWMDVTTAQPEDATPDADGTAAYGAILDGDDTIIIEGDVGLAASGDFIELNSTSIQTTVPVKVTNGYMDQPAGAA